MSKTAALLAQHKQRQLSILIKAMKTSRPQYYMANWVVQSVRHVVNLAQQWLAAVPNRRGGAGKPITSWTEILEQYPILYLRMATTMDLSISNGKLPEESDFPPSLRDVLQNYMSTTASPAMTPLSMSGSPGPDRSDANSGGRGDDAWPPQQAEEQAGNDMITSAGFSEEMANAFGPGDMSFGDGGSFPTGDVFGFSGNDGNVQNSQDFFQQGPSAGTELPLGLDNHGEWLDALFGTDMAVT